MNNDEIKSLFSPELGVIKTDNFSRVYPEVNHYMMSSLRFSGSRNGQTVELLDVKTQLTNPYRRCVGGYYRDINVFFLLAEAMWIALGKKDVNFLVKFNAKMADFSDDGETFHAPYGFRLRNWGIKSEDNFVSEGLGASKGYDQIIDVIRLFSENVETRQVVASIWNPSLDLGCKSKDLPCNDMLMFKIRDGKLITTIQNRSNDLHWGLPTNIFQFSFLTELISASLGIKLGTQTHNSQSLHIYEWSKPAEKMKKVYEAVNLSFYGQDREKVMDMYSAYGAREIKMDFNFSHEVPVNKFREIEYAMKLILKNLTTISEGGMPDSNETEQIASFSSYLFNVYRLLVIYLDYKHEIASCTDKELLEKIRWRAISKIEEIEEEENLKNWDVSMLAKNFFAARLSNKDRNQKYLGTL